MKQNFIAPDQIRAELMKFYAKPVARVSFELILSVVTVIFFALFALQPTLNTMSQLVKEIEDKKVVEQGLSKKIAALSTAQNEYLTYASRFKIFDTAVHENPTLETALFYVEYLVARENISLSGLRMNEYPIGSVATGSAQLQEASKSKDSLALIPHEVQLSFRGSYSDILRFYRAIEAIRPVFVVKNFTFSVRQGTKKQSELFTTATIWMYGFEKKPPEKVVPGAKPAAKPDEGI